MGIDVNSRVHGAKLSYGDRELELFAQIGTSVGNCWIVRDPESGVIAIATDVDLDSDRYELIDPPDPDSPEERSRQAQALRDEAARLEESAQDEPFVPAAQESPQTPFTGTAPFPGTALPPGGVQ